MSIVAHTPFWLVERQGRVCLAQGQREPTPGPDTEAAMNDLMHVVGSRPGTRWAVACEHISALSSASVAALIIMAQQVRDRGGVLALAQVRPAVLAVISSISLGRVVQCFPTLADAGTYLSGLPEDTRRRERRASGEWRRPKPGDADETPPTPRG